VFVGFLYSREAEGMTLAEKMSLYRMYLEQGSICLCTHCGKKGYCASNVMDLSTECFTCAVKRIEEREKMKEKFDLEDFIRL
jgi:hypothetical protein